MVVFHFRVSIFNHSCVIFLIPRERKSVLKFLEITKSANNRTASGWNIFLYNAIDVHTAKNEADIDICMCVQSI